MKCPISITVFCLVLLGCGNQARNVFPFSEKDYHPPVLISTTSTSANTIEMTFDELSYFDEKSFQLDSEQSLIEYSEESETIELVFDNDFSPGKKYSFHCTVYDEFGNEHTFIECFYGMNDRIPDLVINEINPKGSGNNPDCIELFILNGGNMGGLILCWGSPGNSDYNYIFPAFDVETGDYLIVHCQPEFSEEEITEVTDKAESMGKLASDSAWDLWLPEKQGISGNNGVLSITTSQNGVLLDCIVYSDRTFQNDDYYGWTSATFDSVLEITALKGWNTDYEVIHPEEAVFSGFSTSTRSLCRSSSSLDSDTNTDWHTVPTSNKSFGEQNTDDEYSK